MDVDGFCIFANKGWSHINEPEMRVQISPVPFDFGHKES